MRQLRQMLRLHHDGVSAREIGRRLGSAPGHSVARRGGSRLAASGKGWRGGVCPERIVRSGQVQRPATGAAVALAWSPEDTRLFPRASA